MNNKYINNFEKKINNDNIDELINNINFDLKAFEKQKNDSAAINARLLKFKDLGRDLHEQIIHKISLINDDGKALTLRFMSAVESGKLEEFVEYLSNKISNTENEVSAPYLTEAPQWAGRKTGREVTPIDWIKMHYGHMVDDEWDSQGLTQADLSRSDRKLYDAYIARIRRLPKEDLGLPKEPRNKIIDAEKALERKRKLDRTYARRRQKERQLKK